MTRIKIDTFKDYEEQNTLELEMTHPVTKEDQLWVIPPIKGDKELKIRRLQSEGLRHIKQDVEKAESLEIELDEIDTEDQAVKTMGAYWAPILCLVVTSPVLDEKDLLTNWPGTLLRDVGTAILNFFHFGILPGQTGDPKVLEMKERQNRKSRRKSGTTK